MYPQGHLGILHSNPLGMTCHLYFRCKAAFVLPSPTLTSRKGRRNFLGFWRVRQIQQAVFRLNLETMRRMLF